MKWNKEEFSLTCLMILSAFLAVIWGCKGVAHRQPVRTSPLPPVPQSVESAILHTNRNTNVVYLNWTNRPLIQPLQFPPIHPGPVAVTALASTNYGASWYQIDWTYEGRYDWTLTTSNKLTHSVTVSTNGTWTNNVVVKSQGPTAWYKVAIQ